MTGAIVIGLVIGIALAFPLIWTARHQQEQSAEDLRKLRLDLHQNGWNPDRIGKGPVVDPTETDFQRVIDSTIESLRDKGLRPKPGFLDGEDEAQRMMEAFASDPRFQFTKDADGNLMVGLNEDYEA